jgi:glucose-6-phosphate isomerase
MMGLTFDFTNLMADAVGAEHGLTDQNLDDLVSETRRIHADLLQRRARGELGFYDLPEDAAGVAAVKEMAARIRGRCDTLVVLGIGGSALGVIALQTALRHAFHNLLPADRREAPRLFVPDNPDPELTADLLDVIDPETTVFSVVSKSGSTAETMAHYLVARDFIKRTLGATKLSDHLIFTTDPEKGVLRKIAEAEGIPTLPVPPAVGGRFSVLSSVGLLPAAVMGMDVGALLAGAADMGRRCATDDLRRNPAYLFSAAHMQLHRLRGRSIAVMMPYASALRDLADWFRQLWAESLGKRLDVDGRVVEVGQTPVKALGATDQHSQVQLYVEGPRDKVFTFLTAESWRRPCAVAPGHADEDALAYLGGRDLGDLLSAEQVATEIALTDAGRPSCEIVFPSIDEWHIGEFLMMMEIATAHAGGLLGVNAFDQPGVEAGKVATYALMDRPGYAEKRAALEKAMAAKPRRTV